MQNHTSSVMPFIISSNADAVDPTTRKMIRSHVMRGKKQKKNKARSVASTDAVYKAPVELQGVVDMYLSVQPSFIRSQVYSAGFPRAIEPCMLVMMAQVSTSAMRIIFPLLTELGFHGAGNDWLYPVGRDVAALHINAFAIQSFIDRVLCGREVDVGATVHYQKGLKLLQQRLGGEDEEAKICDDTMGAILKLATAALFEGDGDVARGHMRGLRKMIDLRGGLGAFRDNPKLLVEIWRCDLGIALLANCDPICYRSVTEPVPDYPEQVISGFGPQIRCVEDLPFRQDLDAELVQVWRPMKKFCLLADLGTQTRMRIPPAMIYETMTAVMYRLVRMNFGPSSLNETVRMGLLAFAHHVFLQWKDIRLPRHRFSERYRRCLADQTLEDMIPAQVMLWLLMVGAVSIFRISDEPWLGDCLRKQIDRCGIKNWIEMQKILKTYMWVPLLDEEGGKQTYDWLAPHCTSVDGS